MEDMIEEKEGRIYEISYLLVPTIEEKDIAAEVGNLKGKIDALGALTIAEEFPKLTDLAYEMSRVINNEHKYFTNAYFGWIKFEVDPSKIASFEAELKHDQKYVRFLIVKTVRENTMSPKKGFARPGTDYKRRTTTRPEGAPMTPIDKEAIDKEIDALVADEPKTPEAPVVPEAAAL